MNLGNLSRLSNAQSRSISPENFHGEKGKGGMATEGTGASAARDLGRTRELKRTYEQGNRLAQPRRLVFVSLAYYDV